MAIYAPGVKFRNHRILGKRTGKRSVVALLSLTAMVDMFTVLAIFLLQNYSVTGQVIYIPKEVTLPKAEKIKELKPAVVVTISNKEVLIDKTAVVSYADVVNQKDWMITGLYTPLVQAIQLAKQKYEKDLSQKIQTAVDKAKGKIEATAEKPNWNKITIQADKAIDFLTLKKVMYTVTEAGAGEINFAVAKGLESAD